MQLFTSTQLIAKEGWKSIGVAVLLLTFSFLLDFAQVLAVLFLIWILYVYRNPERIANEDDPLAIVAPCDGRIIKIDKIQDEFTSKTSLHVVIKNLIFDVGIIRFPVKGELIDAKTIYGLFMPVSHNLANVLNERIDIRCKQEERLFAMRIRAGMFSRRISFTSQRGNIKSGTRIAFVADGVVELFLPTDTRIKLSVGDYVKSGESILGYLNFKKQFEKENNEQQSK